MTPLVMVYALAAGLPLAGLGLLIDRLMSYGRRPRRWTWASIAGLYVALVAAAPWRASWAPAEPTATVATMTLSTRNPDRPPAGIAPPSTTPGWRDSAAAWLLDSLARTEPWNVAAAWIWIGTSAGSAVIFGVGYVSLSRRQRRWRAATVRGTAVLIAPAEGPAVVGIHAPRIVIPEWSLALEPAALDLMLRHEREHVAAGDPWLVHLAGLALVAMPWNPVVWWVLARLRLAIEIDCDARVLGAGRRAPGDVAPEAPMYGELLLHVVSHRSSRRAFTAPAMLETPSTLSRRITAMYPQRLRLTGLRAGVAAVSALAMAVAVVLLPAPRASAQGKTSKDSAPVSKHLGGTAAAPAFQAPAPDALKTMVEQYAPGALQRGEARIVTRDGSTVATHEVEIVVIQNPYGQLTGTTTTAVLERLLKGDHVKQESQMTEAQAREQSAREEREKRIEGVVTDRKKPVMTSEDNAAAEARSRAMNAEADQQADELRGRLVSIDVVHYTAGELGRDAVRVYFITAKNRGTAR